jgi:hypothetical protein
MTKIYNTVLGDKINHKVSNFTFHAIKSDKYFSIVFLLVADIKFCIQLVCCIVVGSRKYILR